MSLSRKHALLSPSCAHRWLNCPPSARFAEHLPDKSSDYAAEGSLAHEIGELHLRKHYTTAIGPKKFTAELKKLKQNPLYKHEMDTHVETYVDSIKQITNAFPSMPYVSIEQEIDYSAYVPGGSGIADCVIIGGAQLHVVDFKYGQGVRVDVENNPQLMLYALGAMIHYSVLYDIQRVSMTVCQPRKDNIATFTLDASALRAWGEGIKPTAQMAWEGKGEFQEGDWCRFCKAKAQCSARAQAFTAMEDFGFTLPHLLSPTEIGDALSRGTRLAEWLKDVEDHALKACLAGEDIPGWKAVEGRANRVFTDIEKAFAAAQSAGIEEALLYERKPVTLTALEKLLGPKPFVDIIGPYVDKPQGKPTLAPANDKRIPFARSTAKEDFKEVPTHG